jgi:hypothetical protein
VRVNMVVLLTFAAALPVSVEIPSSDTTSAGGETRLGVTGSIGRYALIDRGCQGQVLRTHPHEYGEAGLEAVHLFDNGLGVGVRAGTVREKVTERTTAWDYSQASPRETTHVTTYDWDNAWVNPSIAYEGTQGGVGLGVVTARRAFMSHTGSGLKTLPSFHVRVGPLDRSHLRLAYMESMPLYSGGGYADIGIGSHVHRDWDVYAGIGTGPFDGPGLILRTDHRALPNLAISARTRLGHSGGEGQYGVALGLTYVSRPPREPRGPMRSREPYRSRMWNPARDTLRK